jgi:ribosome recycling factor
VKKAVKEGLAKIWEKMRKRTAKLHVKYIKKVDEMFAEKEKEILTV